MISSVQMFPSTLKLDLFVTAFGVLAPEGQLIRTGGHMHHSKSAVAMSGDPQTSLWLPVADCEPGLIWTIHDATLGAITPGLAATSTPARTQGLCCVRLATHRYSCLQSIQQTYALIYTAI